MFRPQTFEVKLLSFDKQTGLLKEQVIPTVKLIGEFKQINLTATILDDVSLEKYDIAILMNSCDQGYGIFSMDEHSVSFFEKHLSDLCNAPHLNFTYTNLLVTIETLFKMMENG